MTFYTGLSKDGQILKPMSSNHPVEPDHRIRLGQTSYDKAAKRIFYYLNKYRQQQK